MFVSWLDKMYEERAAAIRAKDTDPWKMPLERLRGEVGPDGIERVGSQVVYDFLQIPANRRGATAGRRIAALLSTLGWVPTRVRGLRRGTNLERVRGFARKAGAASDH